MKAASENKTGCLRVCIQHAVLSVFLKFLSEGLCIPNLTISSEFINDTCASVLEVIMLCIVHGILLCLRK